MPSVHRFAPLAAVALAVLTGHVTDKTTSQPLTKVSVEAHGPTTRTTTTNDEGDYTLRGLKPGRYHVTLSSEDVPPQSFDVTVGKQTTKHDFVACSTTLDYSCGAGF
jgi:hypothetical protein